MRIPVWSFNSTIKNLHIGSILKADSSNCRPILYKCDCGEGFETAFRPSFWEIKCTEDIINHYEWININIKNPNNESKFETFLLSGKIISIFPKIHGYDYAFLLAINFHTPSM